MPENDGYINIDINADTKPLFNQLKNSEIKVSEAAKKISEKSQINLGGKGGLQNLKAQGQELLDVFAKAFVIVKSFEGALKLVNGAIAGQKQTQALLNGDLEKAAEYGEKMKASFGAIPGLGPIITEVFSLVDGLTGATEQANQLKKSLADFKQAEQYFKRIKEELDDIGKSPAKLALDKGKRELDEASDKLLDTREKLAKELDSPTKGALDYLKDLTGGGAANDLIKRIGTQKAIEENEKKIAEMQTLRRKKINILEDNWSKEAVEREEKFAAEIEKLDAEKLQRENESFENKIELLGKQQQEEEDIQNRIQQLRDELAVKQLQNNDKMYEAQLLTIKQFYDKSIKEAKTAAEKELLEKKKNLDLEMAARGEAKRREGEETNKTLKGSFEQVKDFTIASTATSDYSGLKQDDIKTNRHRQILEDLLADIRKNTQPSGTAPSGGLR